MRLLTSLSVVLCLTGCMADEQMVLDLSGPDSRWSFYDQGFPTDLRQDESGHLYVADFPVLVKAPLLKDYVDVISRDTLGFAPESPVYIRFSGDIAPGDFVLPDAADTLYSTSAVQLINVDVDSADRGTRLPVSSDFRFEEDEYRPAGLFQAYPVGRFLQEGTTYALIITRDVSPEFADDLTPNPVLNALLKGQNPRNVDRLIPRSKAEKAMAVYAPLAAQLAQDGIAADDVIGAVVWTTGTHSETARHIAEAVYDWPVPALTSDWRLEQNMDHYCVLKADWSVPTLQKGVMPYAFPRFGGNIEYDVQGFPVVQSSRETEVVVTIPKAHMPSAGWPLMMYHHGTYGEADQVWDRGKYVAEEDLRPWGSEAEIAALRGWAASGMSGHFGADHQAQLPVLNWFFDGIGQPMNLVEYNFLNPQAFRDNLLQQVAERILFRRMLEQQQIDPSLCPGATTNKETAFRFDSDMEVVSGQSLGSFTATGQVASDPRPVKALIPSGAGVYDINLVMQILSVSSDGTPLGNYLEPVFFGVDKNDIVGDPAHPFNALAAHALASANTGYMMDARNRRESAPLSVLTFFGHLDDWVVLESQIPFARALGLDMAGPELNVPDAESLLWQLRYTDTAQISYPVSANKADGSTGVFVRYAEDDIKTGHNVLFQHTAAKHQFGCVLQDLAAGMTPTVIAGDSLDGGCVSGPALIEKTAPEPFPGD